MLNHKIYKKIVLVILDGFGVASKSRGNAVTVAGTPNLNALIAAYPHATLQASGPLVGLPFGEPGNSEVGHLSIGAGRIIGQDLLRITAAIENKSFFTNKAFLEACEHVKKHNSKLHLAGLVSDGGVHSLNEHLYALLGLAEQQAISKVFVHFFSDGRDSPPEGALQEMSKLELKFKEIGVGQISTIIGRFYSMDRGGHWSQTQKTLEAMIQGVGLQSHSATVAIQNSYQNAIYDELLEPVIITNPKTNLAEGLIEENDAVIFFNFRQDRMVQITTAFATPEKTPLKDRIILPKNILIATMTEYIPDITRAIAYPAAHIKNHLSSVLSQNGLTQLHIAESEKYAHVTMFFNCGETNVLPGEERLTIDSPEDNKSNYANVPEMSAKELTRALVKKITDTNINFFVANYANADMVGHTGNLNSAVMAVKFLDECLGDLAKRCRESGACLIITADHGNIEQMLDLRNGTPDTDHTANPVPLVFVADEWRKQEQEANYQSLSALIPIGMIADIAPTILELFGLKVPEEMRAVSLLGLIDHTL